MRLRSSHCKLIRRKLQSSSADLSPPPAGPLRVCVVGSGPAGFYTAHRLIKCHADTKIDILEKLPVPFGLVRFGVAPDHPEVKNCINQFTALAETSKCRFIGNVHFGKDFNLSQLQPFYHAIVMAYGAERDRKLQITGENLYGVHSAREFVGWYNGLPAHRDLNPDLSGEVVAIIGQGNVALDVARILLTPTRLLECTDICHHALMALQESKVRRVYLIGRRGPLQVAFTIKELREMIRLPECRFSLDPTHFDVVRDTLPDLPRPQKRLMELLTVVADEQDKPSESFKKECKLIFLRSPVELMADQSNARLAGIRLEINELLGDWRSSKAVGTGEYEVLDCNMLIRSIGYSTLSIKDIPFDEEMGIIPNIAGRVKQGLYCSGWVKTGPVGVILNTMNNAFETAENIVKDYTEGRLLDPIGGGGSSLDVMTLLSSLPGVCSTSFSDWKLIDKEERSKVKGHSHDKPREKIVSLEEMMEIIRKGNININKMES